MIVRTTQRLSILLHNIHSRILWKRLLLLSTMVAFNEAFQTTANVIARQQQQQQHSKHANPSYRVLLDQPPLHATATDRDDASLSSTTLSSTTSTTTEQHQPQHLVLIGGGHAHVQVIKAFAARPDHLRVTLIDPQHAATYSGMVPGCLAGLYTPAQTQIDIAGLAVWAGLEFVHDRVVDVDFEQQCVYTRQQPEDQGEPVPIPYDALSIDIGSTSRDWRAVPGAPQYAIPTRPIDALVRRLQRARQESDDNHDARIVVVGGGVAGIELCMAVQAQFGKAAQMTLLHAGDTLLPDANDEARQALHQIFHERHIDVQHNAVVECVEEDHVVLQPSSGTANMVPFDYCVWATGAAAHPLAWHLQQQRGLAGTKHGWITVDEHLQSTSHKGVFAAGDCAHVTRADGQTVPKAGVYAVRAGPVLVENLTRYLDNLANQANNNEENPSKPLIPYEPQDDFMKLLVCGKDTALGLRFGLAFYGPWVLQMKDAIDQNFMQLFKDLPDEIPTDSYDTSQYDAAGDPFKGVTLPTTPEDAAELLRRTDNDVDYRQAWLVLRTMTNDAKYRQQVLDVMPSRKRVAVGV